MQGGKSWTPGTPKKVGVRVEYRWSTSGVPLEYEWSTSGVPLEYEWSTSGVRVEYEWSTSPAFSPLEECHCVESLVELLESVANFTYVSTMPFLSNAYADIISMLSIQE
jgi:hypothetical protein